MGSDGSMTYTKDTEKEQVAMRDKGFYGQFEEICKVCKNVYYYYSSVNQKSFGANCGNTGCEDNEWISSGLTTTGVENFELYDDKASEPTIGYAGYATINLITYNTYVIQLSDRFNYHDPTVVVRASSEKNVCELINPLLNRQTSKNANGEDRWTLRYDDRDGFILHSTYSDDLEQNDYVLEYKVFRDDYKGEVLHFEDGTC